MPPANQRPDSCTIRIARAPFSVLKISLKSTSSFSIFLQSIIGQITGVESERNQNGVSKTALGPIPIPPFGTLPSITLTGIVG